MIVLTIGSFDALHVGHLELLVASREMAGPTGRVVVGLNTDEFITSYKGHPPFYPFNQRSEMLSALRDVDLVVPNVGGADAAQIIEAIAPDLLTIGSDWEDRDYLGQLGIDQAWLDERGLRIEYVARTRGQSSSAFRAEWFIEDGRVKRRIA